MPRVKRAKPRTRKTHNQIVRANATPNPFAAIEHKLPSSVPSLGDLRKRYSTRNMIQITELSQASSFEVIPLSSIQHTIIFGRDGGLIGYHIPAAYFSTFISSTFSETLVHQLKLLPRSCSQKNMQQRRQIPHTRTYSFWRGCRSEDVLEYSAVYLRDNKNGEKGKAFVDHCAVLWNTIATIYALLWPTSFREITQTHILPEHVSPLAYPFVSLTINTGTTESPVMAKPHRDTGDAFYSISCLYPFGNFTGGELVLWELERCIPLKSGDAFLFPAHLITHSNLSVQGERHSMVAYTKEDIISYYS